MAKNERIIAQDLAELKHAMQNQDTVKIAESIGILSRDIKKYPVKPELVARLERVFSYSEMQASNATPDEKIEEVGTLIDILVK